MSPRFAEALAGVRPTDAAAKAQARQHQDRLTKPRGALGLLEDLSVQLCAIARQCPAPVPNDVRVAVFAGDHGVVSEAVTPWPQEVTAQMVANFCTGGGAINVLSRHAGVDVVVVDVGVASEIPTDSPALIRRNVRRGTGNLAFEPSMSEDELIAALDIGAEVAGQLVEAGATMLVTGDMGIGNTTASAAVIAAVTGSPAASVTGRGTGIDDEMLAHKASVIETALARAELDGDPLSALRELGGLEIAALCGFIVAGAAAGVPVVVDGVIAAAAAVVAGTLEPRVTEYLIAGHRSTEPGASVALSHLGLEPVLDLGLRLGEGTGAVLAVHVIQAAAKVLAEMATFDSAGVTDKDV